MLFIKSSNSSRESQPSSVEFVVEISAEISTTNSTEDGWDSLDEFDDLINSKNEDKAWMLREQIAKNSKESSIRSTNQIKEKSKEVAKIRKEAAIASQQALAEGLNSLAMGLVAVQQQQSCLLYTSPSPRDDR